MFVKLERELTKDDVGKKVKLRNGVETSILKYDSTIKYYPIIVDSEGTRTTRGIVWCEGSNESGFDIVEIEASIEDQLPTLTIPQIAMASHGALPGVGVMLGIPDTSLFADKLVVPDTNPTIQINIHDGMTVIKGKFLDSSGEEWYVTLDKV